MFLLFKRKIELIAKKYEFLFILVANIDKLHLVVSCIKVYIRVEYCRMVFDEIHLDLFRYRLVWKEVIFRLD